MRGPWIRFGGSLAFFGASLVPFAKVCLGC